MAKVTEETRLASQKLDLNIKSAQLELNKQLLEMQKSAEAIDASVKSAHKSADDANEAYQQLSDVEKKAEASGHVIESYQIQAVRAVKNIGDISRSSTNVSQVEQLVDSKLLQMLRNVLPGEQYVLLEAQIKQTQNAGSRRRIYDAKNRESLPGNLVRSEGDAPVPDEVANEVYENLGIIHDFFRDVFGREIADDAGGSLTASIHYGSNYDNGFWDGHQIVLGDGDGTIFNKGAFNTLSMVATEISHAVAAKRSGLVYSGQSGAISSSFGDIFSALVEQWKEKQTADEASWLVMEGAFAQGEKGTALRALKQPGTAYKDLPEVGSDRQVSSIEKIYRGAEDNHGVHTNSGIPNKAFYELAKRLQGYAWDKPAKIWWEALNNIKAKSTFNEFANAIVEAANRLYGAQGAEHDAVVQSWAIVGIVIKSRG